MDGPKLLDEREKALVHRLARAVGHLKSIKTMVENGRDCSEVLIQLASVKAAVNNTGKIMLESYIKENITSAVRNGDREALEKVKTVIDTFVK